MSTKEIRTEKSSVVTQMVTITRLTPQGMQQTVYGNGGASNARKTKDLRERGDKKDVPGKKHRTGIRCKALHFKCHAGENRVLA